MLNVPASYRVPLGISIALHAFLFFIVIIQLPHDDVYRPHPVNTKTRIINAVAIDQRQVEQQIKKLTQRQQEKQARAIARLDRLQQAALAARREREREQHRLTQLKLQQLQQVRAAHARAIADQKAQHVAALARKQKQLQQQLIQQQLQQERRQLTQAKANQIQEILNRYKAQIVQAIRQQWIVPASVNDRLFCILLIHLAPGGVVLNVQTLKSSGDTILDRSARVAVFKASPLPVPEDSAAFDQLREIRLTVRPEHRLNR